MAAIASINTYDSQSGSIARWLYGIARRKVADHLRKSGRLQLVNNSLDDLPGSSNESRNDVARIHAVLSRLPSVQRDVLTWMYRDDLSVRQIADRLNRSEKAVENLLYRARRRFKHLYQSPPDPSPPLTKTSP